MVVLRARPSSRSSRRSEDLLLEVGGGESLADPSIGEAGLFSSVTVSAVAAVEALRFLAAPTVKKRRKVEGWWLLPAVVWPAVGNGNQKRRWWLDWVVLVMGRWFHWFLKEWQRERGFVGLCL